MSFVVMVKFRPEVADHADALKLLDEYIDTFLRVQPGFIESWLSENSQIEGTQNENTEDAGIVHFARWEKEADFRAFAAKAADHPLLPRLRAFNGKASFFSAYKHYLP